MARRSAQRQHTARPAPPLHNQPMPISDSFFFPPGCRPSSHAPVQLHSSMAPTAAQRHHERDNSSVPSSHPLVTPYGICPTASALRLPHRKIKTQILGQTRPELCTIIRSLIRNIRQQVREVRAGEGHPSPHPQSDEVGSGSDDFAQLC